MIGVLAAVFPARRAARLDVLRAIAHRMRSVGEIRLRHAVYLGTCLCCTSEVVKSSWVDEVLRDSRRRGAQARPGARVRPVAGRSAEPGYARALRA